MQSDKKIPSPAQMEEYRRQLLELSRRATPPLSPPPPAEDNWLDSRFPEPHIEQDKTALPPTAAEEPPAETNSTTAPPVEESPFVGYLRIFAFAASEAEPIEGARVVVSRGDTLYANTATNRDGYSPVISLPTVDPALTLQPGASQPYIPYNIQVTAEGFRPVTHDNVPIYGNNYVTQPVVLLPLLPGADPDAMQDFTSGGPANL